jgi:hypothetical protein
VVRVEMCCAAPSCLRTASITLSLYYLCLSLILAQKGMEVSRFVGSFLKPGSQYKRVACCMHGSAAVGLRERARARAVSAYRVRRGRHPRPSRGEYRTVVTVGLMSVILTHRIGSLRLSTQRLFASPSQVKSSLFRRARCCDPRACLSWP